MQHDIDAVLALGIEVQYETPIDRVHLSDLRREFDAVYLAIGAHMPDDFELERDEHGTVKVDPVTFATSLDGVFAGGGVLWGVEMRSAITSISEGRRAGISIDRYLQKVSLTASRINEGSYTSCLYTNTAGLEPQPLIEMSRSERRLRMARGDSRGQALHPVRVHGMREGLRISEAVRALSAQVRARNLQQPLDRQRHALRQHVHQFVQPVRPVRRDLSGRAGHGRRSTSTRGARWSATNRMPASAFDFALRDMAFSNSDKFALARNAPGATTSDVVFFPGCQLSASSPDHVEKVYAYLTERLPDQQGRLDAGLLRRTRQLGGTDRSV